MDVDGQVSLGSVAEIGFCPESISSTAVLEILNKNSFPPQEEPSTHISPVSQLGSFVKEGTRSEKFPLVPFPLAASGPPLCHGSVFSLTD